MGIYLNLTAVGATVILAGASITAMAASATTASNAPDSDIAAAGDESAEGAGSDAQEHRKSDKTSTSDTTIVVIGTRQDPTSVIPTGPSGIFGTSQSILDTPRTISQINPDELTTDVIFSSDDFIKYAPGISAGGGQNAGLTPTIRGQTSELYQDGQRAFSVRHPSNFNAYEDVDIVAGMSSVVTGPAIGSGGYINYVTKKPDFDGQNTTVNARLGAWVPDAQSRPSGTVTVDNTGPITDTLAYRVSGTVQRQDDYYLNVNNDYNAIYGALSWKPTGKLKVDANFAYDDYYDWNITHGWNRATQSLVDNAEYLAGPATPIFNVGGTLWSPLLSSSGAINGWQQRAANPTGGYNPALAAHGVGNGFYATYPVVAGSFTGTSPLTASTPGAPVGFVLDPADTSYVGLSPQVAQRAADRNTSKRLTAQSHITYEASPNFSLVNHALYEHSTDSTDATGTFQSQSYDNLFEDRLELHDKFEFHVGVDVTDESNSGVIVRNEVNQEISANNSFYFINAYDISVDPTREQGKYPGALFGVVNYNPAGGNGAWIGTAGVPQLTKYGYVSFPPMYPAGNGIYGEAFTPGGPATDFAGGVYTNHSNITTETLFTEHNLKFGEHFGLDAGYSHTWLSAEVYNPFQPTPYSPLAYYSGSYHDLYAVQLSPYIKPNENTTLYFTYDHSLTYNTGPFVNGITDSPIVGSPSAYETFHADSVLYEAGVKSYVIPGKLFVTGAYYNQAHDNSLDPTTFQIYRLRVHGVDSSLRYEPDQAIRAGLNFSWLKARYDSASTAFFATQGIVADNATAFSDAGLNKGYTGPLDATGLPAYTLSGYVDYRHASGFGVELSGQVTSPWWFNTAYTVKIPTEYKTDLGLFYRQKHWSASVQILNLTNQLNFVPGLALVGNTFLQPDRGREIFGQIGAKF